MDAFDLYHSATTQADLYNRQAGAVDDFFNFMKEPETDPSTIDVTGIENSTDSKEELVRLLFSSRFHVVYGQFGSNPFGPGNNVMFKFEQESRRLRLIRITQDEESHALGSQVDVFSELIDPINGTFVRGVSFTGGDDLDLYFLETPSKYTRFSDPAETEDPEKEREEATVYNIQGKRNGKIVYNYFVVPISFPQ